MDKYKELFLLPFLREHQTWHNIDIAKKIKSTTNWVMGDKYTASLIGELRIKHDLHRWLFKTEIRTNNETVAEIPKEQPLGAEYRKQEEFEFVKGARSVNGNILWFSCAHLPFNHPEYLDFLLKVKEQYNCATIVCLGDFIDNAACSRHDPQPDGPSHSHEFTLTTKEIPKWVEAFPNMYYILGNHDSRPNMKANRNGISTPWMKSLREVFNLPVTWKISYKLEIDGIIGTHGDKYSGIYHAWNLAQKYRSCTVAGHVHSNLFVHWGSSQTSTIFGMNVGCGADEESIAMHYGKDYVMRPILGCGVTLEYGRYAQVIRM